ncbi:MAG: hypothetical protein LUH18_02200 [Oscillospiraceae bacterium]|nr:hypothetical protein [Oscillospiraceae bacterium]
MKRTMNFKIGTIAAMVLGVFAIVLETLPGGAVLIFSDGSGSGIVSTYSYFSLTPFGYANFAPLITGIMTIALLVMAVVSFIKAGGKRLRTATIVVNAIAVLVSISPLIYGIHYYNIISVAITTLLVLMLGMVVLAKNE